MILNITILLQLLNFHCICYNIKTIIMNCNYMLLLHIYLPSLLCCCWLGARKGTQPIKKLLLHIPRVIVVTVNMYARYSVNMLWVGSMKSFDLSHEDAQDKDY